MRRVEIKGRATTGGREREKEKGKTQFGILSFDIHLSACKEIIRL